MTFDIFIPFCDIDYHSTFDKYNFDLVGAIYIIIFIFLVYLCKYT